MKPFATAVLKRINPLSWFTSRPHEVRLVYFNKLIYAYPLVLASWALGLLHGWGADPEALAWCWITVALFVIATIAIDLPRNQALFLGLLAGFLWLCGNKLADWGFPVWSYVHAHFAGLDVRYDDGTFRAVADLVSIGFFANLLYCFAEHRVRINHNEIVLHALLRRVDSMPRMGSTFQMHVSDFLEFLCGFGSATLEVSRGDRRLVLPDVLFLYPRFRRIDHILDSWGVTELASTPGPDEEARREAC